MPAGSRHLEECQLGRWVRVTARRPSVLLAFPRAAGAFTLPVPELVREGLRSAASEGAADGAGAVHQLRISESRPLPAGSLLYVPRRVDVEPDGSREAIGCLYFLVEPFDGGGRPACAWLRPQQRHAQSGTMAFALERGVASAARGSYAEEGAPFRPDPCTLWLVNHLAQDGWRSAFNSSRRVTFDFSRAEQEVSSLREPLSLAAAWREAQLGSSDFGAELESLGLEQSDDVRDAMSSLRQMRLAQQSVFAAESRGELGEPAPPDGLEPGRAEPGDAPPSIPAGYHSASDDEGGGAAEATPRSRGAASDSGEATPGSTASSSRGSAQRARRSVSPRVRFSVTGLPLSRPEYPGMTCAGCLGAFGRQLVCRGGDGMIHNSLVCDAAARRNLERRVAEEAQQAGKTARACAPADGPAEVEDRSREALALAAPPVAMPTRTGSDQRRAQFAAEMSDARLGAFARCLRGECGECTETPMICLGKVNGVACTARVHGVHCAQISKGHASLGCFKCPSCFARATDPAAQPPFGGELLQIATVTSLRSMSRGAEATGGSYADFLRLEREFMASIGRAGLTGGVLPRDSPEVFMMWMIWLVTSKQRALSLDALFRTAGAVGLRTRGVDMTRNSEVKAMYHDLKLAHGEESHPRTAATRRMVRYILGVGIAAEFEGRPDLVARYRLEVAMECVLGLRVGEVVTGGDFHGMLANNLKILHRPESSTCFVEGLLEHSKTKHKRYVSGMAVTEGGARVELAEYLREYWRLTGVEVTDPSLAFEGGYGVEQPNYYVVRLSLLGLVAEDGAARVQVLGRILGRSESAEVRKWASFSELRAAQRRTAGSMDKRYVNVVGGAWDCRDIRVACLELERAGFGQIQIVPGPLIRSTYGKMGFTHMPVTPQSTYDSLHKIMDKAFAEVNRNSPDPELDLDGLASPLWGHHSFRRFADTVARQTMELTGATEQDIDLIFGWMEAFYSAKMQVHYQATFVRERRAAVTSQL